MALNLSLYETRSIEMAEDLLEEAACKARLEIKAKLVHRREAYDILINLADDLDAELGTRERLEGE